MARSQPLSAQHQIRDDNRSDNLIAFGPGCFVGAASIALLTLLFSTWIGHQLHLLGIQLINHSTIPGVG